MITPERLREVLYYDPETGTFTWKVSYANGCKPGKVAGRIHKGYRQICVDRRLYFAHRLAWLYQTGEWPKNQIDHINGVSSDNRFVNLREATNPQNQRNRPQLHRNTSGFKGVTRLRSGRWQAQIGANRKKNYLGCFSTPEEAYAAYCDAAEKLHGEFANFGAFREVTSDGAVLK